jgi:hypothetical protein
LSHTPIYEQFDTRDITQRRGGYKIRLELLNLFLTLRQTIEDYYKPSFLEVKKYEIEIILFSYLVVELEEKEEE